MTIPNRYFTIVNLADDPDAEFKFWMYLCVKSVVMVNQPEAFTVYGGRVPTGPWWGRAVQECGLRFVDVDVPTHAKGNAMVHYANRCDWLRLEILWRYGGIYVDLDTLAVAPYRPLLDGHRCVMGRELDDGLCNAVIMAEPENPFIRAWMDSFAEYRGGWNSHAVKMPFTLARKMPEVVTMIPQMHFFLPYCDGYGLEAMHGKNVCFPQAFSHHLWHTKAKLWLDAYTPDSVALGTSTFCRLARPFLPFQLKG